MMSNMFLDAIRNDDFLTVSEFFDEPSNLLYTERRIRVGRAPDRVTYTEITATPLGDEIYIPLLMESSLDMIHYIYDTDPLIFQMKLHGESTMLEIFVEMFEDTVDQDIEWKWAKHVLNALLMFDFVDGDKLLYRMTTDMQEYTAYRWDRYFWRYFSDRGAHPDYEDEDIPRSFLNTDEALFIMEYTNASLEHILPDLTNNVLAELTGLSKVFDKDILTAIQYHPSLIEMPESWRRIRSPLYEHHPHL